MKNNIPLIAAVDAGTTGVRCCIFNSRGNEISGGYYKVPTVYPKPGLVEQNAGTVIELAYKSVAAAVADAKIDPGNIAGLCITAQRNGFVPMDADGNFLSNMFIWQDQRGAEAHPWMLERLASHNMDWEALYRLNGQPFGAFQEGNKAIWIRKFAPELYHKTNKFVTPHAFLTKAFGAEEYLEENNNRGFWLAADADTQEIRSDLCRIFDLDPDKFLKTVSPGTKVGILSAFAAARTGLLEGTPIYMGSGDQQCGVLGAGNYGTSNIVSVCMGTAGLCIAYSPAPIRHPEGKCQVQGHPAGGYLLEGHSSSCMSSFAWVRDLLFSGGPAAGQWSAVSDSNAYATGLAEQAAPGANGVVFLPWLQGAECPHYDEKARGAFIGMSLATKQSDMFRATMEGICFENRMMIETLQEAFESPFQILRVIGGAANNEFWNQMQADIYGLPVETIAARECTALGAAVTGAVAAGIYNTYQEAVREMVHVKRRYLPDENNKMCYNKVYSIWDSCYKGLSFEAYGEIHTF